MVQVHKCQHSRWAYLSNLVVMCPCILHSRPQESGWAIGKYLIPGLFWYRPGLCHNWARLGLDVHPNKVMDRAEPCLGHSIGSTTYQAFTGQVGWLMSTFIVNQINFKILIYALNYGLVRVNYMNLEMCGKIGPKLENLLN